MSLELNDLAGDIATVSKINANFQKIEDWANINALWRSGLTAGQANQMNTPLDMNGYAILNAGVDLTDPDSLLTLQAGNSLYVNVAGDMMVGQLSVQEPAGPTNPVRKDAFDAEVQTRTSRDAQIEQGYKSADANLQSQISGGAPLEASAFSPISWHDQVVENSVDIPDNKNAWSFGPTMSVGAGATVSVGDNSFWTIANGEVQ